MAAALAKAAAMAAAPAEAATAGAASRRVPSLPPSHSESGAPGRGLAAQGNVGSQSSVADHAGSRWREGVVHWQGGVVAPRAIGSRWRQERSGDRAHDSASDEEIGAQQ